MFVEVALFNDDLELRRLVRELLRSTYRLVDDVCGSAGLRREFVRRGMTLRVDVEATVGPDRNDLLRSKLCRFRSSNV